MGTRRYQRRAMLQDALATAVCAGLWAAWGSPWALVALVAALACLLARCWAYWRNRARYPEGTITGRNVAEIETFLRNVGVTLPLPPGPYALTVVMTVGEEGYVIWRAKASRMQE
jgi:hypothetical protein